MGKINADALDVRCRDAARQGVVGYHGESGVGEDASVAEARQTHHSSHHLSIVSIITDAFLAFTFLMPSREDEA